MRSNLTTDTCLYREQIKEKKMEYKFKVSDSELELLIKAIKVGAIYSNDRFEKAKYRYLLGEFEDMLNGKPQIEIHTFKKEDLLKPFNDIILAAVEETFGEKELYEIDLDVFERFIIKRAMIKYCNAFEKKHKNENLAFETLPPFQLLKQINISTREERDMLNTKYHFVMTYDQASILFQALGKLRMNELTRYQITPAQLLELKTRIYNLVNN